MVLPLPLLCVLFLLLFLFCFVDTVCGLTTEYLDLIDYSTVRCCTAHKYVSYVPACCCVVCCCTAFVAAAAAACCCCSSSSAGWQKLFPWFTSSDSSGFFLFKNIFFSICPLAVLSRFQRRSFTYNTYNTPSVERTCAESRRALAHRGGAPLY